MKTNLSFMQNLSKIKSTNGWFYLGLVISLSLTLAAFEWRTTYKTSSLPPGDFIEEPIIFEAPPVCIVQKIKEKPEVSKAATSTKEIVLTNQIELVDNNVSTLTNPEFPVDIDIKPIESSEEIIPVERDLFIPIEQMPEFPGGEKELMKFLNTNVKYPKMSRELGITGIVFVEFIVDLDGSMNNIKIAKGVSTDIDKEAIRVVGLMPKWIPGSQRNQPVQVGVRLPIRFTLM